MLIQATGLVKHYNKRAVVNEVDFCIKQGEILAVIGPNGAGKTTLIEMLIGLRAPDEGRISYWEQSYKQHIGVQLQSIPFFPQLSALENLKLFASFYKRKLSNEQASQYLQQCGIAEGKATEAARLSGGQQKRLAIVMALLHDPQLLFLDEPTAELDPRAKINIHTMIKGLNEQGKTIVFSSHNMDEVSQLASRLVLIDKGRVIAEGEPAQLLQQQATASLTELYVKMTEGGDFR